MIYLSSFRLSNEQVKNPNIYPYHVFRGKDIEPFVFSPITVLYGNNGSGKSTILNIMANKLMVKGREYATSNSFGIVDYCGKFSAECCFSYGEDEFGNTIRKLPENSRFIKSEDILYEIKKIQQKQILADGMEYGLYENGHLRKEAEEVRHGKTPLNIISAGKILNGEEYALLKTTTRIACSIKNGKDVANHIAGRRKLSNGEILAFLPALLLPHYQAYAWERWMQRFII